MNDAQLVEMKRQFDAAPVSPALLYPIAKEAVLVMRILLLRDFIVFYEKMMEDKSLGLPDISLFFASRPCLS